jgi:hypothetical protein
MEQIRKIAKRRIERLEIAPGWKKRGYVAIGNKILYHPNLSYGAKVFYWYLLSRCFQKNKCFPGHEMIGKDLNVSHATVIKWQKELIANNLIKRKRRGWGKTNIYILKF